MENGPLQFAAFIEHIECKVSLTVSLKMNQSCLRSRLIQEKSSTTWRLQVKRLSVTKVTQGVT